MIDELDINGEPPFLDDQRLDELKVQSFWYNGVLEEEANVIFLKVAGKWHRLYFDCGIIFWRPETKGPKEFNFINDDGSESSFPVINLGADRRLVGKIIESYTMEAIEGGSKVDFTFEGGEVINFINIDDITTIRPQPNA